MKSESGGLATTFGQIDDFYSLPEIWLPFPPPFQLILRR